MGRYLVLIYGDEQVWADAPQAWHDDNARQHGEFHAAADGAVLSGGELAPTASATCLRGGPDGQPTATDGPFVETKEAVGGFYLIRAADDQDAVRLAGLIPEARAASSGVEIRRVLD